MNTLAVQSSSGTGAASGAATGSTTPTAKDPVDPLTDKQTFITLLVAQLKNQDPLNPTDGVQFLSQLTEISSVEQLVDIRQDTDILAQAGATPVTSQDGSKSSGSDAGSS
ncbi:MAG TPA: flagellar hook capping FlgD N-terminal domain-containing protein [Bryobacteraceae bacterium]|nr:flagellar hook capping FlgD N-terminal domain-containing protein [Bryobacteraceae bacterium]